MVKLLTSSLAKSWPGCKTTALQKVRVTLQEAHGWLHSASSALVVEGPFGFLYLMRTFGVLTVYYFYIKRKIPDAKCRIALF